MALSLSLGRFRFMGSVPQPPAKWGVVRVRMYTQQGLAFFSPFLVLSFDIMGCK